MTTLTKMEEGGGGGRSNPPTLPSECMKKPYAATMEEVLKYYQVSG